jgi:hypothetical protein
MSTPTKKELASSISADNSKYENSGLWLEELFHEKNIDREIIHVSSGVEAVPDLAMLSLC